MFKYDIYKDDNDTVIMCDIHEDVNITTIMCGINEEDNVGCHYVKELWTRNEHLTYLLNKLL